MIWSFRDQSIFVFQNSGRREKCFLPLRSFLSWSLSQPISLTSLLSSSPLSVCLWFSRSFSLLVSVFWNMCWKLNSLSALGALPLRVSVFLSPLLPGTVAHSYTFSGSFSCLLSHSVCLPPSVFSFLCIHICVSDSLSLSSSPRVGLSPLLHSPTSCLFFTV